MFIDIPVTTNEEILAAAESFFSEWNDVDKLIETVKRFVAWEERNPVEKRRTNEIDYEKDPVPGQGMFTLSSKTKEHILKLV